MTRHPAAFAMTGAGTASELPPGSDYGIHLDRFNGAVYYTVSQEGYRVVATIAEGYDGFPVRFVSSRRPGSDLGAGKFGWPNRLVEFERIGDRLFVNPYPMDELVSVVPPVTDRKPSANVDRRYAVDQEATPKVTL